MAIELIKNGAGISAPVKPHPKNDVNGRQFELTLSETKAVVTGETVVRTDSVVITNTLTEIKKSFGSSRESSMDVARLARIKHAIENGTYEINPDRVAAKMMQFESL